MTICRLSDVAKTIEVDAQCVIRSVLFAEDGKQVLTGAEEGMVRWWRVDNGREVGEPIQVKEAEIRAAALSPDRKWLVCGLRRLDGGKGNVRVWDAKTRKKVLDVEGHTNTVLSVDISPDSTQFATGSLDYFAYVWCITTGKRLLALQHEGVVLSVRFSPTGDRIATATAENPHPKSIHIYDTENGQLLLDIPFRVTESISSPLAWSTDGRHLFAAAYSQVKRFDASSGSLLTTWSTPGGTKYTFVVLSRNQKFAAVVAYGSLSFWDTSTNQQIGTTIENTSRVRSIALSPTDDCLAIGDKNRKVTLRSLRGILPASYLAVNVSD